MRRSLLSVFVAATPIAFGVGEARAEAPPDDVVEVKVRSTRPSRDAQSTSVGVAQARLVPGTQGDAAKVVQSMPGVGRASVGGGTLVVWGAAPQETRVFVDGVEVPALFHGGGLRSIVPTDLVSAITLVPGAFGPDYGRALGGVVRVETRALPSSWHAQISGDTLDTSAFASAEVTARVRVAAAGRVSYLDRVVAGVTQEDVGDYFPIPRYRDYQAKASLALREGEELSLVFLGSDNRLTRAVPSSDPEARRVSVTQSTFHRLYMRYTRNLADGARVDVTPFVGVDDKRASTAFGALPTRLDVLSTRYGVRASHRSRLFSRVTVTAGVDASGSASTVTRAGSLTLPAREGDAYVFGQGPGADFNTDTYGVHVLDIAPHVVADIDLGPLTVTPGLRFDAVLMEGDVTTPGVRGVPPLGFLRLERAIDPRVSAKLKAGKRVTFTAAAGTYHQPPEPEDLGAVFGTPDLVMSRAFHATAGESVKLTDKLTAEVTGFYRKLDDLVVRSRLPTPKLARALIQDGEGRSYGVQISIRHELARGFFGWLSYTASRSERRYYGDASYRLFDYDQPHVLTALGSYATGGWTFGARFRYATGLPRTPVTGAFYEAKADEFQPVFGGLNTTRIPSFAQLDLRVDRAFDLGDKAKLSFSIELQNVTFRKNREEIVYGYDYARKAYIEGLPAMAIVGARLER